MGASVSGWQLCPSKKGGGEVGSGWKGKGSTIHLLTDGEGIPLAALVRSVLVHEQRVALAVVDQVRVPQHRGRPKQRPRTLAADRGYDSGALREALRRRGIRPSIPQRRWPGKFRRRQPLHAASAARWIVERTHAWLDNWRRLVVRWERSVQNYTAFLAIACFMTCLRRILG
ncbi:MAG TPA: IS5 family transposase [Dehalococcoidia bacterium]|nr:IS5 family transposase [Dehalococcoidia bacterium]